MSKGNQVYVQVGENSVQMCTSSPPSYVGIDPPKIPSFLVVGLRLTRTLRAERR